MTSTCLDLRKIWKDFLLIIKALQLIFLLTKVKLISIINTHQLSYVLLRECTPLSSYCFCWGKNESFKRINTCNVLLNDNKKNGTTFEAFLSRKHLIKSISSSNKIFKKSICKAFTYISYVQIILYGLQGSESEVSANNF